MSNKLKAIIGTVIIALVATITGVSVAINTNTDGKVTIINSEQSVPAVIELDGKEEVIEAPTVESVDAEVVTPKDSECPEDSEECAKGAVLPAIDITSPTTFYNSVLNQCIDFDGAYGSQCYDEMAYFHYVYTGRWLSTAGTGGAYGIWDARDYNNKGNEYELVYNVGDIKPGDFVVFHNGRYGHVGMAVGYPHNGYVALLGTNQGGSACPGGGAAANVINMNLWSFSGAFRPRSWIPPEPTPEPEPTPAPSNVVEYTYVKGDYFSKVIQRLGLATSNGLWGKNGDVAYYNAQLLQQGILNYYGGKYWNNIPVGTTIKLERR